MNVFELCANLVLNAKEYIEGLDEAEKKGSNFGSGLRTAAKVAGAAIAGATTAVAGFVKTSVDAGMSFDSAMSQVAATMSTSVDQITELRDFAQEMGSTTAFSATEAAEALNYMALAGYDATTSMDMLPTVLNLAAAGSIDLASASDMVTDASSALNLTIEETSTMVDQMARASSQSNTSVEQLGQAMLAIGATAANMSGGTQEIATILGVLADNGIKGAEGGTHLRNILLSLQDAADDKGIITFNNGLKDVNVALYDADGNMRSVVDVITEMQSGMEGMSQQAQDAMVQGMFNRADLASVNALLGTSSERFYELQEAIGDADGAAQAMADTQLDNLSGDITLFKSALEGAQIAISDQLTPTLREFVQLGSEGLSDVTQAFQEGGLDGAMSALGAWLSDALTMIIEQVPALIRAGMQLLGAVGQGIIDNAPQILQAGIEVIGYLGQSLIQNAPVMIPSVIGVITDLVRMLTTPDNLSALIQGGIQLLIAVADGIVMATPDLISLIPEVIANVVIAIVDNFPLILEAIGTLLGDLGAFVFEFVFSLGGTSLLEVADSLSDIGDVIRDSFNRIKQWFSELWGNLSNIVSSLWSDITSFFSDGLEGAANIVSSVLERISGFFTDRFNTVRDTVTSAIEYIKGLFDFEWSLPQIQLPHFSISGGEAPWGFGGQGSLPRVSVDWYARAMSNPMLLTDATIFGYGSNGRALGGGEAGDEMIYGRNNLMKDIAEVVGSVIGAGQPNVIQVYIGSEKLDEFVVSSTQRTNYISGGRG